MSERRLLIILRFRLRLTAETISNTISEAAYDELYRDRQRWWTSPNVGYLADHDARIVAFANRAPEVTTLQFRNRRSCEAWLGGAGRAPSRGALTLEQ